MISTIIINNGIKKFAWYQTCTSNQILIYYGHVEVYDTPDIFQIDTIPNHIDTTTILPTYRHSFMVYINPNDILEKGKPSYTPYHTSIKRCAILIEYTVYPNGHKERLDMSDTGRNSKVSTYVPMLRQSTLFSCLPTKVLHQ